MPTKQNNGKMDIGNERMIDERESGGLRRSPHNTLSDADIEYLKGEIAAIEADESVFSFNTGRRTCYNDGDDTIDVRGDVFPDQYSSHPRDVLSERAVLAHEYYGHRAKKGTKLKPQSWNDEFRASYLASKNTPNLSDEDRAQLIMDALERAKEAGVVIRHNEFMRKCLHGY